MKADFGSFGGKHVDGHDSPGGFTSMITFGDIAEDEDPGVFIVGDLGVVIGAFFRYVNCCMSLKVA